MSAKTYTAFCQEADGTGTIWIQAVGPFDKSDSLDCVIQEARETCAHAWGQYYEDGVTPDVDGIHCLGLAEGNVNILMWDDDHL